MLLSANKVICSQHLEIGGVVEEQVYAVLQCTFDTWLRFWTPMVLKRCPKTAVIRHWYFWWNIAKTKRPSKVTISPWVGLHPRASPTIDHSVLPI